MTPVDAIAMLDSQLSENGESVALRHITSGATTSTDTPRAFVRGYRPDEVAGAILQGDTRVVLSPTGLTSTPKQNDKVVVGGSRVLHVQGVETIRLAGTPVRYNLQARG